MARLGPGTYEVEAVGGHMVESQKGTLGIVFLFECEQGTIESTQWVTEKTVDRVTENMETLGYTRDLLADDSNLDKIGKIVKGHRCKIVVEDEEYNGDVTAKVKYINPLGGGTRNPAMTKAGLHALFNGNSITAPALRSAPRARQAPAPVDPEDVPF